MGCVFGKESLLSPPSASSVLDRSRRCDCDGEKLNIPSTAGTIVTDRRLQAEAPKIENATGIYNPSRAEEEGEAADDDVPKNVHHRRRHQPNPRPSNHPKGAHGDQVAAGWPAWLSAVAGEVIKGWTPRRVDSFEKIEKIGQGTYSNVYKARDTLKGMIVALKKVWIDNLEPESVKFMAREILILRRLDHPNVVKLMGLVTSRMSCSLYLVMQDA